MFQHGSDLRKGYAGEQLSELADWHAVVEVLEEGFDRHARAAEPPGSA